VTDPATPWDPQPGEPPRWYARFEIFRLIGPHRTMEEAYRITREAERLRGKRPGTGWYTMARDWDWAGRFSALKSSRGDEAGWRTRAAWSRQEFQCSQIEPW